MRWIAKKGTVALITFYKSLLNLKKEKDKIRNKNII